MEARASVGAGFIYLISGDMRTMPGLGAHPAAELIDLDENGEIVGLTSPAMPVSWTSVATEEGPGAVRPGMIGQPGEHAPPVLPRPEGWATQGPATITP